MAKYVNILLQRSDSSIPWGFKISEENGNGVPLPVVNRVTPGTIASNYLQPGDMIIKLSHCPAKDLLNEDIEDVIRRAGNCLELIICKRPAGSLSPSSPAAVSPIPGGVNNNNSSSPRRFTPTSPIPPGVAHDYTNSPGIPTPPLPPYPTYNSSPIPYTPPPPPHPLSFSPVASPRSSMVFPSAFESLPSPPPPPMMPPSPMMTNNANTLGGHSPPGPAPPPPPPPPPLPSGEISVPWRVKKMHQQNVEPKNTTGGAPAGHMHQQFDKLPAALQSTMLKDKKPFTYTPGGIDLSELRSPRMQRRIHVNQMDPPRNLARVASLEQPAADIGAQVTSPPPPPPETYPHTRVQLLPSAQGQPMVSPAVRSKPSAQAIQSPQQQQQQQQQQQPPPHNVPAYTPEHYNSPVNLYSTDNMAEAYQNQTGEQLPGYDSRSGNMVNDVPQQRRSSNGNGGDGFTPYYRGQQAQSRSFRLLQVMTDTTSDAREDGGVEGSGVGGGNTTPKTPVRGPDDEMKFTGFRRNPIPSRAFQTLQRITGEENGHTANTAAHPPVSSAASQENPDTAETELRYRGAYIPSRTFRILQEMTGERDEDVMATRSTTLPRAKKTAIINVQIGSREADSGSSNSASPVHRVPPSEQKAEAEPKKYTGACIPSKSFRMLQAMTGSDDSLDSAPDISPVASSSESNAQSEGGPRMYMGGNIPSRSFRLLQAMTDPDRADGGHKRSGAF